MIVVGIGSQRAATVSDITAAIAAAEQQAGVTCTVVASLARGGADEAITAAAHARGLEARFLPRAELEARCADCATRSEASLAAYGLPSVAEAAALAAAGAGSRMILPRQTFSGVTAAVAAT